MKFQLKPDNRNASNEDLLSDLTKVAKKLGSNSIKMRDYDRIGRFHSGTISRRFNGWNNALEKAGLNVHKYSKATDEELIADVNRIAKLVSPKKLTQKLYSEKGKYTPQTISDRLGWNVTLKRLNLEISLNVNFSEKELFDNLEALWIQLGHAPRRRDMALPLSKCSERPYLNKYGSWRKALEAFVEYINDDESINRESEVTIDDKPLKVSTAKFQHKTKRDISERLKVAVLIRDGNICRLCGITVTGKNIHFDHIKPWAKGGETVLENIQVLCAKHNLAKGDYYEES